AEDGIRDLIVTGVQTCALPISISSRKIVPSCAPRKRPSASATAPVNAPRTCQKNSDSSRSPGIALQLTGMNARLARAERRWIAEIGRASCRERVEMGGLGDGDR